MLYLETQAGFELWGGQAINGIVHPLHIEQRWTSEELAAIGLFVPEDPGVPEGKIATSMSVQRVGEVVVVVYVLEDAPPPSADPAGYPLTARQLRLGLIRHGITLSTVQAAISAIGDGQQRDEAQVYWEFSTVINWSHPMTRGLMALAGITPEDAAAMWMVAKDYEA